MTYVNQNWTSRTGFTGDPSIHNLYYEIIDNRCDVKFFFFDFTVAALGGAASFTIPLPVSAIDSGSRILGGNALCGFGASLLVAVNNDIIIPDAVIGAQTLTVSIPNYLNDGNRKSIVGTFSYSFGVPS